MSSAPDETELLALAERAARAAAAELLARHGRGGLRVRAKSSPTDPVSAADIAAERAIRDVLGAARPQDSILGEEGGETGGTDGEVLRWVVDPLDGTVNYLYGYPAWGVSVACEDRGGAVVGVVLDPARDECFAATRSGPATLNGEPIAIEPPEDLARSLVATGFGYEASVRAAQAEVLTRLLPRVRDIRRGGSAALDLCSCACGRVDAYFERGVRAWDYEAGALICMRAGLSVRRVAAAAVRAADGRELRLPDGIVVAPPALITELEAIVSEGVAASPAAVSPID